MFTPIARSVLRRWSISCEVGGPDAPVFRVTPSVARCPIGVEKSLIFRCTPESACTGSAAVPLNDCRFC